MPLYIVWTDATIQTETDDLDTAKHYADVLADPPYWDSVTVEVQTDEGFRVVYAPQVD